MNILGIGGHAKVVIHTAELNGYSVSQIYDDDVSLHGSSFYGHLVLGLIDKNITGSSFIAIGNNAVRQHIDNMLQGARWETIIHPSAIIANDVIIGEGSIIMAGAIIQPGSKIGRHCIINTGSIIDHDCNIHDYVHIAPNCGIAGAVNIESGTFVGIGSNIIQGISIGSWSIIGAGAVVAKDIPSKCTAVGIPAKPIKFH